MNTCSIGVFVPQLTGDAASLIATAQTAERSGFDSFWVMDHLYAAGAPQLGVLESWVLLSAIATQTSTLRLGQLVGCNPFRHPALTAKMAASLDQISSGRFDLGLGWGSIEEEFTMFGFEVGSRRERSERLAETIEILRLMFAGEAFDYAGKHFQLKNAWGLPVPAQGRIPIHIGGAGKQLTMPLVAEYADWWNCVAGARKDLDELAALRGGARISVQYPVGLVHPNEDPQEVRAKALRRMPEYAWGEPVVGTPEQVLKHLAADQDRGVELFIVRFHDKAADRTLELFGREVAGPLRARAAARQG
jgi:alkanesulfonate monooxygenase SsuD/methylene tetrahydromethanopterin reductase-like flavin-dependent oxidoreductase (luciferase family)